MRNYLTLLLLATALPLAAQDYQFSDPARSLLFFNPAYTGYIPERARYRFNTVARSQWATVLDEEQYRTFGASYDMKFCGKSKEDYFALGVSAAADFQGQPAWRRTDAYLTGSFVRRTGGDYTQPNLIGGGVELGYVQYGPLDPRQRTFDEQFDDPDALPEIGGESSNGNFDVGVGVFGVFAGNADGLHDINVGVSMKHLTQPVIGYLTNNANGVISSDSLTRLNQRLNVNFGASFLRSRQRSLSFFAAYSNQRPHNQVVARLMFNTLGSRETNAVSSTRVRSKVVSFGVGGRFNDGAAGPGGDALMGIFQVHQRNYIFSLVYDHNVSALRASTDGYGALEVGATFFFGRSRCLICPEF